MTHSDHTPHRPYRFVSLAAVLVAGQVLAAAPLLAQDVTQGAPAPVVEAPAVTAPVSEAPASDAPAPETPAATAPAATPAPVAEVPAPAAPAAIPAETAVPGVAPAATAPADAAVAPVAGDVPAAAGDAAAAPTAIDGAVPPAQVLPVAEPAPEVAPEPVEPPMPNPLEDPLGAASYILAQPEKGAIVSHDLSPWGMFRQADIVVKAVMLGLVFASLVTWTVFVAKTVELAAAKRRAQATLRTVHRARSLAEAITRNGKRGGPASLMLRSARAEVEVSEPVLDFAGGDGVKERIDAALRRIEVGAGRKISIGTGVLATIGSTAPFVGLFGTVWGIMNSFIGIAESQTTNLAVVAPGIAEALLATAIGLVAAIPAVMIYNHFARTIARYKQILSDTAVGTEILVSRDLDFRKVPAVAEVTPLHRAAAE